MSAAPTSSMSSASPLHATQGNSVQQRFRAWWIQRITATDHLVLTQKNVYIMPSKPGWMLALTLLVLLIASINYQLNLGYLLTFLLAGSAVIGMHICHATLRGLSLQLLPPEAQFMGHDVRLDISLANAKKSTRYSIGMSVLGSTHWAWSDVPAQGSSTIQIGFMPHQRGLHSVPALTAETRFPLGTFRVWCVWRPAAQVLIYPAPEASPPPLPPSEPRGAGNQLTRQRSSGEFDGVRAYQRGDPLKLVVWKKAAKAIANGSDELISRDNQQAQRNELWLDYAQTGLRSDAGRYTEAQLSRLCAWILQAEKLEVDYGLRLPGLEIPPNHGQAHQIRCLEALARC